MKRIIIFSFIAILMVSFTVGVMQLSKETNATPIKKLTVVLDAGHGGIDGGVVGYSGQTCERDINLSFVFCLATYFKAMDFRVVYTRTNENGLYSEFASNKKKDDMKRRAEIIKKSNADLVISIHQNGYIDTSQRGATTFYKMGNEQSQKLAHCIQSRFISSVENARKEELSGDFYILNCSNSLGVLIECGFLTNKEEEMILQSKSYQSMMCHHIFTGVMQYYLENNSLVW